MSLKSKGINAERELVKQFAELGAMPIRIAGSGCSPLPCPDVLVGKEGTVLAIECKVTKGNYQYFSKEEIKNLELFSKVFGATPMVAVKFNNRGTFFHEISELNETTKNYTISFEKSQKQGKDIKELIK